MEQITEPIRIFENNEQINYDTLCSICYQNMEDNIYTSECNHKFHNNCIISWFRISPRCPLCNSQPLVKTRYHNETIFSKIINYSRRKNADKQVVKIVNKYKKKQEYLDAKKIAINFKRENKAILNQSRKYNIKRWFLGSKLRRIKKEINEIPIAPLILR
jgi:hypothetical protein